MRKGQAAHGRVANRAENEEMWMRTVTRDGAARFWAVVRRIVGSESLGPDIKQVAAAVRRVNEAIAPFGYDVGVEFGWENLESFVVITAGGVRAVVPNVVELVRAAPEDLRVRAFRPSLSDRQLGSMYLTTPRGPLFFRDVGFRVQRGHRGRTDVIAFLPEQFLGDGEDMAGLPNAIFQILDHVLGEYIVITKVGAIEVAAIGREEFFGKLLSPAGLKTRLEPLN
jgi:hypothetical protein